MVGDRKLHSELWLDILPIVHIGAINSYLIEMAEATWIAYQEQGVKPIITGACDRGYKEGGVHKRCLAIDLRIWNVKQPANAANRIRKILQGIDPRYRVLYGDKDHLDHIHVGYGRDADKN